MITDAQRVELNNGMNPVAQKSGLGDAVYSAPVMFEAEIAAAANATPVSIDVPFACEVIDVTVQARAASGSGTATLRKGTSAISDAIAMAVDTTIARAGTIDDAYSTLAAGDSLNVITNGANDRGLVQVVCKRL